MESADDELTGLAAGTVVLAFVGSALVGFIAAGPLGAFLGAALAAFGGIMGVSRTRMLGTRRMLDEPRVDLRPLPPQQALAVLSTLASPQGRATFRSALLARLDEIRAVAPRDPHEALILARELSADHPRNPAARAELSRRLLAVGERRASLQVGSEALALALDGGMNPAAAALFDELAEHRDALVLAPHHLERLARVLEHHADPAGSAWCRARLHHGPRATR